MFDSAPEGQPAFLAATGPLSETHAAFVNLSELIEPDGDVQSGVAEWGALAVGADDRFGSCVGALVNGNPSEFGRAVGRLSRYVFVGDAEDLATDKVLSVCARHARQPLDDIVPYFNRAVTNVTRDLQSGRRRDRRALSCDVDRFAVEHDPLDRVHLGEVQRAICGLDPEDAEILHLAAEGLTGREIAARMDVTPEAARQRLARAREALRSALRN